MFATLCRTLGLPLADDARFATNAARCENNALLKRLIEAITLGQPVAHWIETLEAAGLPTGKVQTMAEVLQDPQLLARHMVLPVEPNAQGTRFTAPGNPIKMSSLPEITARAPAPALDGDRMALLAWLEGASAP